MEGNMGFMDVGKEGSIQMGELNIQVVIVSARSKPQAVQYLCEPLAGEGRSWVDADKVILK